MIRVPVYMNEEIVRYKKAVEALTHKLGRKPQYGEVAKKLQLTVDKIRELDQAITKMASLDAPIGEDGDGQVKDIIEDESLAAPDEQLELFLNKERTKNILEELTDRERQIIEMRFGIKDGESKTLAQIADVMGVSRERVRQLEASIIKKLRQIADEQESGKPDEPDDDKKEVDS
jgi:RNA polymerase primary sigma factor